MKKRIALLLTLVLMGTMIGCGNNQDSKTAAESVDSAVTEKSVNAEGTAEGNDLSEAQYVIKVGCTTTDDNPYNVGLRKMNELLREYTDGAVKLEIYGNSQLGGEREMIEAVGFGTLEAVLTSTGPLPNFSKDFMVFDLPFLITDKEKAYDIFDGEIGRTILNSLDSSGIKGMGYWECGYRHITNNNKEIVHPEDVAGLKLRTMENEIHMDLFKTLGATPTPMSIGDFQTAVRQGTVDGHENAIAPIYSFKLYEVQKYITLSGHLYSPAVFLINKDLYDGMPDDIREGFDRAEQEVRKWEREYNSSMEEEMIEEMKEYGTVFSEIDKNEWIEATKSVYDDYKDEINQDYVDAFLAIR